MFDGKHGVLLQAMAGYFARPAQGPRKMLAGPDEGALERLHAHLLRAVHGVPLAPDRTAAACFAAKMALEIGASDPEVKCLANDCFSVVRTAVAECVRAAQRNGDPDADPDDLAYLLLIIIRGSDVVGAYDIAPADDLDHGKRVRTPAPPAPPLTRTQLVSPRRHLMPWRRFHDQAAAPMTRLANRVVRSEPALGPLQLHRLDRKTGIACSRCGTRSQTTVVATLDADWTRLVDRGCYNAWSK
ncbi:TetR family transcriptional regulator C-terminal domain-containing protein [Streptomyces sp. NPDC087859]|uniref:TetR family transcriptional regulator C-terminal domain-containing protein n=1 Tax=Streptomyces sp. NPDC087859 TaxID=3365812 RepID=UPI00382B0AFE